MLLKESKLVYQPAFFIVTEMKSSLRKSLTKTLGLDLVKRLLTATTSTCWKTDALRLQYKKPACKHLQAGFYVYESLWSQGSAARNACSVTKTAMLSIPLKSGKCCKFDYTISEFIKSSQSLWSQGSAARRMSVQISASWASQSLWSQGSAASPLAIRDEFPRDSQSLWSQGSAARGGGMGLDLISTLNPFEVREVLQGNRCPHQPQSSSQSLWSQGSAARVLYKTFLLKSISYLLVFVKNFLTKSYFPKFCKEHILVTEVLWHKFAFDSGFFERCVAFIFQ